MEPSGIAGEALNSDPFRPETRGESVNSGSNRGIDARPWATALALAFCVWHFANFDFRTPAIATDIRYYFYFAWQLTEGVAPHISGFDPKTQAASFAGALFFALAEALDFDPLLGVRIGYLGLSAAVAWMAFFVHRRLSNSHAAGWIGAACLCAFPLIGALSAVGNWPKLLMALATPCAALLAARRHWFAAGAVSFVAFLDWQIGVVVCIAVFVSALCFAESRARAAAQVVAGGLAMLLPYALYFAYHGALGAAFEQSFISSFHRGASSLERTSFAEEFQGLIDGVRMDSGPQFWLVLVGLAGIPLALVRCVTWRGDARLRLLLPLTLTHLGVVLFCLVDFQGRADTAILLISVSFFLALVLGALLSALSSLGSRAPRWLPATLVVGALIAARPGPFKPDVMLNSPFLGRETTLADQREVAKLIRTSTADRKLAVLQNSELLWLMKHVNPLPTIYWNTANLSYFRTNPEQSDLDAITPMLAESEADAVMLFNPRYGGVHRTFRGGFTEGWTPRVFRSMSGSYEVTVYFRD